MHSNPENGQESRSSEVFNRRHFLTTTVTAATAVAISASGVNGPDSNQSTPLQLSWPRAAVGYILQANSSLDGAAGWRNDTNALLVASGIATVTVDVTGSPRFYRLVLP